MDQERKGQLRFFLQQQNVLLGLVILLGISVMIIILFLIMIIPMGSTPPNSVKAHSLLPMSDNRWDFNISAGDISGNNYDISLSNKSDTDRFLVGRFYEDRNFPFFPLISKHSSGCVYKEYTLVNTNNRYIAEAAWFDTREQLFSTETELSQYLARNGNVSRISLDLKPELLMSGRLSSSENISNIPTQYTVTQYTSNTTSGYFLILENSNERNPGSAIIYYGTIGPSDILLQSPHLKVLIFRTIDQSVLIRYRFYGEYYEIWSVRGLEPLQ
jgi:hypothetical protein